MRSISIHATLQAFFAVLCFACMAQSTDIPVSSFAVNQKVLADGLEIPYAITVIGEDEFLVTERMGGVYHYDQGSLEMIAGIPESITFMSDRPYGGVLEVSLHPDFQENRMVYVAYDNTSYEMVLLRFVLEDSNAEHVEEIFSSDQFGVGARIAWEDDDHFFLTFGTASTPLSEPFAQDLMDPRGKIFRLHADGSIPDDNPVFTENSLPGIWSYGHRDAQGLVFDKETGILYSDEHGPMGGDELNIIEKGGNYGWPLFSYGLNYDGSKVSDMTAEEAGKSTILPVKYWTPDFRLAPGCLLYLKDSNFEDWNGSFLIGGLTYQHLVRYDPATDSTEIVLAKAGRVRDIKQLPSGDLVVLIEQNSPVPGLSGRIVKLSPE